MCQRKELLHEVQTEIEKDGGEVLSVPCDVTVEKDIKNVVDQTIQKYGHVDILLNLAQSGMGYKELDEVDKVHALLVYETGPLASLRFMQACLPHMKEQQFGRIINMGFAVGYNGANGFGAYGMAKEAIRSLTRTAANKWGRFGITANVFYQLLQ